MLTASRYFLVSRHVPRSRTTESRLSRFASAFPRISQPATDILPRSVERTEKVLGRAPEAGGLRPAGPAALGTILVSPSRREARRQGLVTVLQLLCASFLSNSHLIEFRGYTHVPLYGHPEAARIMREFLDDPSRTPESGQASKRRPFRLSWEEQRVR